MDRKVGILTDCLCDLPKGMLNEYGVEVIYFHVNTFKGKFIDTVEVTAQNVFQYVEDTGMIPTSSVASTDEFTEWFEDMLDKYEEVIYVSISGGVSEAPGNARTAIMNMGEKGKKVTLFDTGHLSTGEGHLVLKAAELAEKGYSVTEITGHLNQLKDKVSTSFIVESADFLYYNGKIPKKVKNLCDTLSVHPVLVMKKGELVLSSIMFGNYERACRKYVKNVLKNAEKFSEGRVFITQAGCPSKMTQWIRLEVENGCRNNEVIVTSASATVSSNCGPNTFGILYMEK